MPGHRLYAELAANRGAFLKRLANEVAPTLGMAEDWRGRLGLTGAGSARPGYLRRDVIEAVVRSGRDPLPLTNYVERIRDLVKETYGDHYDAQPFATCEAALWASLEVLAAPPMAGRGPSYPARYVALHESYIHHHVAYGRPFPPRYKDLLAERLTTAGELGIEGRRLAGLDVVIVPMAGARYEVHGIRPQVVPLMVDTDAALTAEAVHDAIRYHAGMVTAVCAVGYETTGCGRGRKSDGATSDLMIELGRLARRHNIPFIVDKARGIPGLGSHPDAFAADVTLFSMDKAAGALTSGLAIGPEDRLLPLRRAMGMHGDRAGNPAYGKGVFAAFDPGREALASLVAALTWLRDHRDLVVENTRRLHALAVEAFASLSHRFPGAILIEPTADSGGVEINYTRTWSAGGPGIPIFTGEDGAAGTHLITAGLASLGLGPCGGDEGNLFVTPERGLVDDDGGLIEDRARIALVALARVIEVLADMFGA